MRSIRVRTAAHEDLPWCRKVDAMTPIRSLKRSVREDEALIAELRGLRIGYLRIEWLWSRYPYVAWIYVARRYRRRGVGGALLRFLEAQLAGKGFRVLHSSSQENAPEALKWHRKMGFVRCGRIVGINSDGSDEVFFRKALPEPTPSA